MTAATNTERVNGESGFSLIELLVAMTLLLIVMGAIFSVSATTGRLAPRDIERAQAVREAQVGLARMVRELRHTYEVVGTTATSMNVRARVGGQDLHLLYQCDAPHPDDPRNAFDQDYRRCVRYAASPGTAPITSATPSRVIVDRILSGDSGDPIFEYSPNAIRPTYVSARVEVPARGERLEGYDRPIRLDDGFFVRNLQLDD